MKAGKRHFLMVMASSIGGIFLGSVLLILANTTLSLSPLAPPGKPQPRETVPAAPVVTASDKSVPHKSIGERNLFRTKLQAEIPKQKSEKETETDKLTALVSGMTLKGVQLGTKVEDTYAVIDKGAENGVWTYELGEEIDQGLILSEIKKDSVMLKKGTFTTNLKLFTSGAAKAPAPTKPSSPPPLPPLNLPH